jgi:regulator of protease activity HflC (stomatin/prohibitin superfamily)
VKKLIKILQLVTKLSTEKLLIFLILTPATAIFCLMTALIISVGGGILEAILGIILTLILLCIIAFGYITMGIGTTDGSNVDIFEFLGQRPNASRYLLTTDPPSPDEEVPVDGTFDIFSLLRPRVVKGLYFSLVGFHQKVASVDTTQRTLEYISDPDEEIDLPEVIISGLDISSKPALKSVKGRVPYRVINPVQTFYNVNASLSTGPNSPGYLVELNKLFDEAVREAIGKSTLSLDEILSQSYKLGPSVTQILKDKVLSTNMGIWVGNVTVSNADPSDAILKARESSAIEAELGKGALQKVKFRQRAIAMLMGYNEDGSLNNKILKEMRLTKEEAINQENLDKLIESGLLKEMNLNTFGSGVLEAIQGIISQRNS